MWLTSLTMRHCDAPRPTVTAAQATANEDDDDYEHDETSESGAKNGDQDVDNHVSAAHTHEETEMPTFPPPTESVGWEPHGDHYHCDGAAPTDAAATAAGTRAGNATNGTTGDSGTTPNVVSFTGVASVKHEGGKKLVRTTLVATMAAVAFAAFT